MRSVPFIVILLLFSTPAPTALAFNGLNIGDEVVKDATDVADGVNIVTEKLQNHGYQVEIIINHAAAAASVDLPLRPTQVILARPPRLVERILLRKSPTLGIDLPLKFLVFEDGDGKIHLISNSLGYLLDRHDLKTIDPVFLWISRGLNQLGEVENGLVTVQSTKNFNATVDSLTEILDSRGFRIPLVLDFNIRDSAYRVPSRKHLPTLIVFGNPSVGTPLMQESQSVAIDLPQKFLVWKNKHREVFITYNDPAFLADRHRIVNQDGRIANIQGALADLAAAGAFGLSSQ